MQNPSTQPKLGLWVLVMMAIISVDSLRNLPISAQFGASLVFFYGIAGLGFLLPLAWVTAKLAIQYPKTGGSYIWIRAAFGHNWGHFAVCLQWVYNMIWYPTIFAFITSTFAALIGHHFDQNKGFVFGLSLALFWLVTWFHSFGLRFSKWINVFSAVVGTLLPMGIIMGLAAYWIAVGNKIATPMHHWQFWVPNWRDIGNIGFFSNILFSLLGIEVIAVYAGSVLQPKKTYPQAVAIAAWIILMTLILSSLALCVIVPAEKIGLLTGLVDVIQVFFAACHLEKMTLIIGCCIIIGGLGIASSWMLGLAKSLHISLTSMPMIPDWLKQLNHHQVPTRILGLQGLIYSLLLTAFLFMPSLNRSYWMLSAATAQFALVYYMILFSAAVKLLNLQTKRVFNLLFPLMGLIICGIGLFAGFIPPVDLVGLSS